LNFSQVHVLDFPSHRSFERNAQHALRLFEMFGMLPSQIPKEAVNRRESNVARARLVSAVYLEMLKEGQDFAHGELFHR